MNRQNKMPSGKKRFQTLAGLGGACVVLGFLLAFTVVGLPLGIVFGIAGVILIVAGLASNARHVIHSRERPERKRDR